MNCQINLDGIVVPLAHAPAANTAAVITMAAASGTRHVLHQVFGGYSKQINAAKNLTIVLTVAGTSVTFTYPVGIVMGGTDTYESALFDITFARPLQGDDNTAITITLAASGDAAISGMVNAVTQ